MSRLIFDIETLPAPESKRSLLEDLAVKNSKKKKADAFERSSLDGNFGRIFCIGYIKEPPKNEQVKIIAGNEKEILEEFWRVAQDIDLFVGHNIIDFDLKFIYKRSIINGIKPTRELSFARYRSKPIYDTMREWEKWSSGQTSLDTLAKIFDLPTSKDKMSGSSVYPKFKEGKYEEIYQYCKKDVLLTRQVFYKMTFQTS